ncbi:MAG: hypothetical protein FWE07_06615 [Turicibacter sp.]|nr:hypothetical protein [Turicibacter sp.]
MNQHFGRKGLFMVELKKGSTYVLNKHMPGYYRLEDAKLGKNQSVSVLSGEYIVFDYKKGLINVTKVADQPGFWVNPRG